jgi:hypothetical protein
MAKYFNHFPKIIYSANNNTSGLDTVTSITSRFGFTDNFKLNSSIFYTYDVQDSDTPEIIAGKFYQNPERHWIVLMFNDIVDPQYDWPLKNDELINFIDTKYSSSNYADTANTSVTGLSWAMNVNNVQAYYKIVTKTNQDNLDFIEKIQVDTNTYANVAATTQSFTLNSGDIITQKITKQKQSYYDYELTENENKRTIKLVKPEFINAIEKEFKRVIK